MVSRPAWIGKPHQQFYGTFKVGAFNFPSLSVHFVDVIEGVVTFFFRFLAETRGNINANANPFYLSSQYHLVPTGGTTQEVQKKQQMHVAKSGAGGRCG